MPEKPTTPGSSNKPSLTDEERERFFSNWLEQMPEVASWTDDEILTGILSGM